MGFTSSNSQVADLAYKLLALPIIGEMGMYNTITGSSPVLTTTGSYGNLILPEGVRVIKHRGTG